MNKVLLCLTALVLVFAPLAAHARSIPGAPNEVQDPWFIDHVDNNGTDWYVGGGGGGAGFTPNQVGSLPGYYYDPGRAPGDVTLLRTIVDDFDGLWDDRYHQKEIDLFFYAHLAGDGFINVRFDWWDDPAIPKPSNVPGITPLPDGVSPWYTLTATNLGDFEDGSHLIMPGEEPGDGVGWTAYSFHDIWDHQPRWVSIEIELGNYTSGIGGEALITGIDFEAQCIPEPATLMLVALGGLALLRRRK